ncbi:hypothetical protein [Glycomyces tenuis]|uniref:hypothetical protein n=1 Tax=Glycomyces tenuis TaxID=58116 RepID=UPI000418E577|nr:hypothetical protein [Glycomyces tenuis]
MGFIIELLSGMIGHAIGDHIFWRKKFMVTVADADMRPAYPPGGNCLARVTRRIKRLHVVVVAPPHPVSGWSGFEGLQRDPRRLAPTAFWLKRVAYRPGDLHPDTGEPIPADRYYLLSDKLTGTDSRELGLCPRELIYGVILGSRMTVPLHWPPKT